MNEEAVEAAAKAMHNDGWTCEAHEPLGLDECERCATRTRESVEVILSTALPHIRKQLAEEGTAAGPQTHQTKNDIRSTIEQIAQEKEPGVVVGTIVLSWEVTSLADDGHIVHGHRNTYWGNPFTASSLAAISSADIIQTSEPE